MPYKDPEKYREYQGTYYSRNRGKILAQQREYRQALDPEKRREYAREWRRRDRAANPEKYRAQARARWANDDGKLHDRNREYHARRRASGQARTDRMKFSHGLMPEEWAVLWEAQDGRCYLCGEELSLEQRPAPGQSTGIDHDHSCCPRNQSCATCRRGLAHANCNAAIGLAADDPAQLRRMADALEAAQLAVERRKAAAGTQQQLMLM